MLSSENFTQKNYESELKLNAGKDLNILFFNLYYVV